MPRGKPLLGLPTVVIAALIAAPAALTATEGISTVAGNGTQCTTASTTGCDDGGAATSAELNGPQGVSALPGGGFLIADTLDDEIDEVSSKGVVTVVAGDGSACADPTAASDPCGDGGKATSAQLNGPRGVAALPGGGFLIADFGDNRVREVSPSGIISTVAGDGTQADSGDGGAATAAAVELPRSLALLPGGGFLIAAHGGCLVREVASDGKISTVAGDGTCGFSGDGGDATDAELDYVTDVAALSDGGFLLVESVADVIREVSPSGIINIVAGIKDQRGDTGDGGPATSAEVDQPRGLAVLRDGGFIFAEEGGNQVRMVSPKGIITTIAGDGTAGFKGDGGSATAAELDGPEGVALMPSGGFLIADTSNQRIRYVAAGPPTAAISAPRSNVSRLLVARGADIRTTFSCTENPVGPGLASCNDNQGRHTRSGGRGRLRTKRLGRFTYTVEARSTDGQTATAHLAYSVVRPLKTSIESRRARVHDGQLVIALGCNLTLPAGCAGRLLLTVSPGAAGNSKRIVAARGVYELRAHRGELTLTLTRAATRLLAAVPKHRLLVTVEAEPRSERPVRRVITLLG